MNSVTVNISIKGRLLKDIDRVAKSESRSRSELLREAARLYIAHKERWARNLAPGDVAGEITAHRRARAAGR